MKVKATISGKALATQIAIPARTWLDLGHMLRTRIQRRTVGGRDADNGGFEPYSPDYAKAKAKMGGSLRVNLTSAKAGGHMLDDITITTPTAGNVKTVLHFASAGKDLIARYHMGEGRVDRLFFALSDDDEDAAFNYLLARMGEAAHGVTEAQADASWASMLSRKGWS